MRNYEMKFIIDLLVNWFTQYKRNHYNAIY